MRDARAPLLNEDGEEKAGAEGGGRVMFGTAGFGSSATLSGDWSQWHRCTNAIFAGNMVVTTKHVYVVLWGVLLLLAMKDMSGSITATGWNGWAPNSHNWKSHTHINTADDFYD